MSFFRFERFCGDWLLAKFYIFAKIDIKPTKR